MYYENRVVVLAELAFKPDVVSVNPSILEAEAGGLARF